MVRLVMAMVMAAVAVTAGLQAQAPVLKPGIKLYVVDMEGGLSRLHSRGNDEEESARDVSDRSGRGGLHHDG